MSTQNVYPAFRWFVFIAICIVTASTAVALIAPAPLMGPIAKTLGISLGEATGATMGSFNLFVGISALLGGWFLDKFGAVRVWIASLILIIVGEVAMPSFGTSFGGLNALRIIQGIGTGPIMASTARVAAQWFPVQERGIVTGIQGMAMGLGIAIGFMLAPAVFGATGDWAETLAWLSIMPIIALVMALIIAFGPKAPNSEVVVGGASASSANDFMQALKLPATWAAIACVTWAGWIFQGINDLVPAYIAIDAPIGLGKGPMVAGQYMTIFSVAFMVGAVLSGFLVEKVFGGRSRPVVFLGFAGTAVFSIGLKFPVVTSSDTALIGCLILAGLFSALLTPPSIAFIARNYPEHITGKLGGMAQGIGIFGGTAGVFAGAYALHSTGFYYASLYIVVVISIIGCIFALGQNPPKIFSRR
ncbi:MAG: rane protein, major facilitator superfamily [Firmicutes bacterium]|nr:rane protein, major facilitator superfamily [Bacillota bacterium]